MSNPVAVLISDVHYSVPTLELADRAMRQAIAKANELDVPLIVAGDLHDTKANMRGECVNAMLATFVDAPGDTFLLVGNHDKINEKSLDNSLNFLAHASRIVDEPQWCQNIRAYLVPYQHDPEQLRIYLRTVPKGSTIIMHQGLQSALAGDYIQDRSAITHDDVKDFRVISGHYHTRQDIKTGRPRKGAVGLFSYIGNPYTLNFAEANDPPKGLQILMDDGTLEFVPINLRAHIVLNIRVMGDELYGNLAHSATLSDLVKVKLTGTKEELAELGHKESLKEFLKLPGDFKLELIEIPSKISKQDTKKDLSQEDTLDAMIDSLTNTSDEKKARLKELWKSYCN